MADNTILNLGSGGDTIATDDIAGIKHQLVKLEYGIADSATMVSTTNPLPVVQTGVHAVNATLAAETTKVIGTVNLAAAQTLATVTAVTAITNALPAGANAIGKLAANSGVIIGDVNVVSNIPGTTATSLGKAEDAGHTSGDTGVMMLAVQQSANTSLVSTNLDYSPIQVDANGSLKVAIISGAGSGGTALADAAAFTRGTTSVTPIAGVVETSAPTLTNGNTGTASLTTGGAIRVDVSSGGIAGVLEDAASAGGEQGVLAMGVRQDTIASSTSADGDFTYPKFNTVGALYTAPSYIGANAIAVNNGTASTGVMRVTVASDSTGNIATIGTSVTPGTAAANLGKAEDAAAVSGDTGVAVFAVRRDTPSSDVSAAGDYATIQVDSTGQLWTRSNAQTSGGASLNSLIAPATPAKNVLTAAASQIYAITCFNLLATPVFLKIWDNVTGSVTLGTTACNYQFMIPGNTAGAGFSFDIGPGVAFTTGIITAVTNLIATTDNTAITANSVIVNVSFK